LHRGARGVGLFYCPPGSFKIVGRPLRLAIDAYFY
jgi:hypothetical protein